MTALEDDCGWRKFQRIGKEPEQCQVGPAVDRWRGEADFQGIAMQSGTSGRLRTGLDVKMQRDAAVVADVCIFDPRATWQLTAEALKSRGKNSPWTGCMMTGKVKLTLVAGRVVYEG